MKYVIALDIGGSSIKSAVISGAGAIIHELQTPIVTQKTPQSVVDLLVAVIVAHKSRQKNVVGVGIGSPGPLDPQRGIILFTPNLPFKKPFPLGAELKKRVRLPIVLQNDANVAVLGEGWKGAGRGARVVVMLTLGTGVGGGVLIDGNIFDGAHGQGTELGHFPLVNTPSNSPSERGRNDTISSPVPKGSPAGTRGEARRGGSNKELRQCGAGHPGCLEAYVNSAAITEDGKKLFGAKAVNEPLDLYRLAQKGDRRAQKYFEEYGRMLAVPVSYLINVFNPEVVIFGGAISGAWNFFAPTLKKEIYQWAFSSIARHAKLKPATLGNRAGILGAAKLALDKFL